MSQPDEAMSPRGTRAVAVFVLLLLVGGFGETGHSLRCMAASLSRSETEPATLRQARIARHAAVPVVVVYADARHRSTSAVRTAHCVTDALWPPPRAPDGDPIARPARLAQPV